jgi:hypothetical protein
MARTRKPEPKGPDWPADKTLVLLRQQLELLQKFRGRSYRDVEYEENSWQQFTRNVIIHGFGESSTNLSDLLSARYAGVQTVMGVSEAQLQQNFELRIEEFQATLNSSIKELEAMVSVSSSRYGEARPAARVSNATSSDGILVLVSHSSKDKALAESLIELLKSGLGLVATQIRCSSVDGYRLPAGVNTDDQLRREVKSVGVLIGLLTHNSVSSTYVLFELGARWGAELFMIPLFAGIRPEEMRGPHSVLNGLSCESEGQLIQLVEDVGSRLRLTVQSASSYLSQARAVMALAESGASRVVGLHPANASAPVAQRPSLSVSLAAEGAPPSQVLRVKANRPVTVTRLEYMLTDGTCIEAQAFSYEGQSVDVPLSHDAVTKLFNTNRPDMNHSDHSGPIKLGLTVSTGGRAEQLILPARMDNDAQNSTLGIVYYRKVVGSKEFHLS